MRLRETPPPSDGTFETIEVEAIGETEDYKLLSPAAQPGGQMQEMPIIGWQLEIQMEQVQNQKEYRTVATPVTISGSAPADVEWAIEFPGGRIWAPEGQWFQNRQDLAKYWNQ